MMKFWQRTREKKLHRQWSKHAGLPPKAIPQRETPKDITIKAKEKDRDRDRDRDRVYLFKVKILNLVKRILGVE